MIHKCGLCGRRVNELPDPANFGLTGVYCAKCDFVTCLDCGMKADPNRTHGINAPCGRCRGETTLLVNKDLPPAPTQEAARRAGVNETLQKCMTAFAERDYLLCAQLALAALQTGVSPPIVQVCLISLKRLGLTDSADKLGELILTMFPDHPWDTALIKLTLGQAELADLEGHHKDRKQFCELLFYAGARWLTGGDIVPASSLLNECVEMEVPCLEAQLAEAELEFMFKSRPQAPEKGVTELRRRVNELLLTRR